MKDAVHHLKRVQKKVIQETRKSSVNEELNNNNTNVIAENSSTQLEKLGHESKVLRR